MKKRVLNLAMIFIAITFVFTNCSDDDSGITSDPISAEDAEAMIQLDNVSDQVGNLLDGYFVTESLAARSSSKMQSSETCWTKSVTIDTQNQIVTLDFGDGCTIDSGDVIKGQIILTYSIDFLLESLVVNYTYNDFYFNDLSVTGTNKIEISREDVSENPQSVLTVDEKITWPSGDYAMRKGTKTRVFVAGFGTNTYSDNVFLITGNWTDTFSDGTVIKGTVIEDLKREMTCKHFVSGELKLEKNEMYGTLNFGDGTCDNDAIFVLSDGTEIEIELK